MRYDYCPFCGCIAAEIKEVVCDELGYIQDQAVGWKCYHCGNWDIDIWISPEFRRLEAVQFMKNKIKEELEEGI